MADFSTFYNDYFSVSTDNNGYPSVNQDFNNVKELGGFIYITGVDFKNGRHWGLITKLTISGELIWKKFFEGTITSFKDIEKCPNGDLVISWKSDSDKFGLLRINPDGIVVWNKQYTMPEYHINSTTSYLPSSLVKLPFSVTNTVADTFLLVVEAPLILNTALPKAAGKYGVFKIDGSGDIIGSYFSNSSFNAYTFRNNTIVLANNSGLIVSLDIDFNVLSEYWYLYDIGGSEFRLRIKQIVHFNNSYYILGFAKKTAVGIEKNAVLVKVFVDANGAPLSNIKATFFDDETSLKSDVLSVQENFVYVSGVNKTYKFDHQLNLLWKKNIGIIKDGNFINLIVEGVGKLGRLNIELDSCVTTNLTTTLSQLLLHRNDAGQGGAFTNFTTLLSNQISIPLNLTEVLTLPFVEICPVTQPAILYQQSPHVYLQPAGSTGQDGSATGIHLRWMLKGIISDHLPKGNLASTTNNFNRPNDFVTIYRMPYVSYKTRVDFSIPPNLIDDTNHLWVYTINTATIYINFKDTAKYDSARVTNDPLTNSLAFIQAYGDGLIEIENKEELFFAVEINVTGAVGSSVLQTEILSVEDNKITAQKNTTIRKTYNTIAALNSIRLVTDNIRCFRFKASNCFVDSFQVELYSEAIKNAETNSVLTKLGDFALTTTDSEAFSRLEPTPSLIHGKWQRYNDNAFVNINNYQQKWSDNTNGNAIREVVQNYITLSDALDNPTAIETVNFSDTLPDGATQDSFDFSNLYLLQVASLDYHVARMLGLGYLDIDTQVQTGEYVYLLEYFTSGDLQDGEGAREVRHLYMTTPTAIQDEKLPIPVELKEPVLGITTSANSEEPVLQTDEFGYSEDGKTQYITLYAEELAEPFIDNGFYNSTEEFDLADVTTPVYAGIEYKLQTQTEWRKPELPNTPDYQNTVPQGETPHNETIPIPIPDPDQPVFIQREKETGIHIYGSYGVNWFSRITRSAITWSVETNIQPNSKLQPPSNINPLLIVEEEPLLLTAANEQIMLNAIPAANDKTLIRLSFDYFHIQDAVSYKITTQSMGSFTDPLHPDAIFPDAQEKFPEEAEIFFRDQVPQNISGKAKSISDDAGNELLSIIRTENYRLISTGGEIIPEISPADMANFIGGVFILENSEFIIHAVEASNVAGEGPVFKVYKKEITDAIRTNTVPSATADLQAPVISADGLFMAIENMLNPSSWGTSNPHPLKVRIGNNWAIHREIITSDGPDDIPEKRLEKTRGIWDTALIEKELEVVRFNADNTPVEEHRGMYKITFDTTLLNQHPQYNLNLQNPENNANSVEWFKGILRVHSTQDPNGLRKVLEAVRIEHIGDGQKLVVFCLDQSFPVDADPTYNAIQIGANIEVSYYPGYRVYLYADASLGITEQSILPSADEGIKYSIFGLRTVDKDTTPNEYSDISIPKLMFAQEIVQPQKPILPVGVKYATRPDTSGRATYTLTTQFTHTPYSMVYLRVNEHAILNALYTKETIQVIKDTIGVFADDEFVAERWSNLLRFDYNYTDTFNENGRFSLFPIAQNGYRLPNPDKPILFNPNETPGSINPGNMLDRVKDAIFNAFLPLTEMPLIYQYIRDDRQEPYQPIAKKQVIRDRNGALLKPTDADFDIAPMAKIIDDNKLLFTDFALDGTSDNLYFYAVREMGNTLKIGDFSPILGPVKLVNTKPAQTPEIKRILPVLENELLGINPAIQFEINAYPDVQKIYKINIYRTLDPSNALSIRTMDLVKVIDVDAAALRLESVWVLKDEFNDLSFIPYGDPLYYRITVARKVEYADKNGAIVTEYAPSEPSKLLISNVVEVANPVAPIITYTFDAVANDPTVINTVILKWDKVAHNATYHLYKMNSQGNWVKIYQIASNEEEVQVLLQNTNLQNGSLLLTNAEGDAIYHHFKVDVENSSGLFNTDEKIITIPSDNAVSPDSGIGSMIIENTNIIR